MRNDQAEEVGRLVGKEREFQTRMQAETAEKAHGLIQSYLGPDHKVRDMQSFYSALAQALKEAREQGQVRGSPWKSLDVRILHDRLIEAPFSIAC